MAISTEARAEFAEKAKPIKEAINVVLKKEKDMLSTMNKDSAGIEYKKMILAEDMIYIATLYIAINNISVKVMDTKNNDALNDSRKSIYKSIIYMEDVVSNFVDCPYSDLEPKHAAISNIPVEKRFLIIRKLGLVIQLLADAFGDNSKWKWSFVEMRGRFTVVAKNLIDMKAAARDYFDPRAPEHDSTVLYVRLIRSLLDKSASEYREKYELSTRRIDDLRMAINFLIALRRVAIVMGDKDASEEIRKKAVVWKEKMEADQKSGSSK